MLEIISSPCSFFYNFFLYILKFKNQKLLTLWQPNNETTSGYMRRKARCALGLLSIFDITHFECKLTWTPKG